RRLLILPDAREQGCKQHAIRDELRGEFMGTGDHGYDHLDRVGEPSHVEGHPEEGFMLCRFATREFAAHLEGRLAIPDAPEAGGDGRQEWRGSAAAPGEVPVEVPGESRLP